MSRRSRIPIALTIAGSDSGGGAGIQADLKTFASLEVHGTSVITCLTAQNPKGVHGIEPCKPAMVCAQLSAVFAELPPAAVKTGMLYSPRIVSAVRDFFSRRRPVPPLIVDPVMVATSKAQLIEPKTIQLLKELLPMAALVTPNLPEAEALIGLAIRQPEDMREAARLIKKQFRCAALVKGGHLENCRDAVDIFYDGKTELLLMAPFIKNISTHGTGCTYSAAIAAYCARGCELSRAVQLAKNYITKAIAHRVRAAKHRVLNSFWEYEL